MIFVNSYKEGKKRALNGILNKQTTKTTTINHNDNDKLLKKITGSVEGMSKKNTTMDQL